MIMDHRAILSPPRHPHGFNLWCLLVLSACLSLAGCARQNRDGKDVRASAPVPRTGYEVHFSATRLKDKSSLLSVTVPASLGRRSTVRTSSKAATEDAPALTQFTVLLSRTGTPGTFQLVTKVAIREAARNKKGKLKVAKRNQGSLLPVRLGEEQVASSANDPIQIAVRVERR